MPAVCAVCFPCHSAINSPLDGRTSWHCKCWKRKNQKHPISLWRACNLKIFTNSANDNLKSKQFLGRGRGTNQSHPSAKSPFERGHILPSLGSGDLSPCPAAGPGSAQPDSASSTQVDLFQHRAAAALQLSVEAQIDFCHLQGKWVLPWDQSTWVCPLCH